jgi:DNA-binding NarL/FixJ family response regulator
MSAFTRRRLRISSGDRPRHSVELSSRQREVLRLLVNGRSMKEVAATLKISKRTVAFHKYRMTAQLGIWCSAELVQYGFRRNIV